MNLRRPSPHHNNNLLLTLLFEISSESTESSGVVVLFSEFDELILRSAVPSLWCCRRCWYHVRKRSEYTVSLALKGSSSRRLKNTKRLHLNLNLGSLWRVRLKLKSHTLIFLTFSLFCLFTFAFELYIYYVVSCCDPKGQARIPILLKLARKVPTKHEQDWSLFVFFWAPPRGDWI